jgi:hypothetical protein
MQNAEVLGQGDAGCDKLQTALRLPGEEGGLRRRPGVGSSRAVRARQTVCVTALKAER